MSLRDEPRFNDEDIMILAQSVEAHDFDRIDPPAHSKSKSLLKRRLHDGRRTHGSSLLAFFRLQP